MWVELIRAFPSVLRVIDHRVKVQYPLEVFSDFGCVDPSGGTLVVPGRFCRPGMPHVEGYRTDFASIPTKLLKRMLEPWRLKRCSEENIPGPWVVYVYHLDAHGIPFLYGYLVDPIAYAAVIHDWLYSTEQVARGIADRIFYEILVQGGVWSAWPMYAAVRAGGWTSFPHPADEVTEDLLLGAQAVDRWCAAWGGVSALSFA